MFQITDNEDGVVKISPESMVMIEELKSSLVPGSSLTRKNVVDHAVKRLYDETGMIVEGKRGCLGEKTEK